MTRSVSPRGAGDRYSVAPLLTNRVFLAKSSESESSGDFCLRAVGARLRVTRSVSQRGAGDRYSVASLLTHRVFLAKSSESECSGNFVCVFFITNRKEKPILLPPKYLSKLIRKSQTNEIEQGFQIERAAFPVFISSHYHMNMLSLI